MTTAAKATKENLRQAGLFEALETCRSADEWLAALRKHPAAVSLTDGRNITFDRLRDICAAHDEATRVCSDAKRQAIV